MRLPSLLVAIFSAMVVADSSWSSFQEDNAIDDIGNPYSQPEPGSLSAQSDSVPTPDWVASTDLIGKNAAVFEPDCTGFEYTLCCTGIQTEDWNETDGKFFSITNCEKYAKGKQNCHPENWYCCHSYLPGVFMIPSQGSHCQDAVQKKNVVKRQPQPPSRWQD